MPRLRSIALGCGAASAALLAALCGSVSCLAALPNSAVSVGFILKPVSNPYFSTMSQGASAEAAKLGVRLTTEDAANLADAVGQANALSTLISHGYSCYLVNPVDPTNLVEPLVAAQNQHRPIVNIDLPIAPSAAKAAGVHIKSYIGTDNVAAGKLAAEQLEKMIPQGAKVAVIGGLASDPTSQARIKGFKDGAAGKLDIVQTVAGNWKRETALNDATTIMQNHPDIKGFFVANGDMALGVQRAIGVAGKQGKIDTIAVIGDTAVIKEIKDGTMAAAVEQFPYTIGQMGVQACVAAAEGKSLRAAVATPVEVVTKANAAKALAAFPQPFEAFADPFSALVSR